MRNGTPLPYVAGMVGLLASLGAPAPAVAQSNRLIPVVASWKTVDGVQGIHVVRSNDDPPLVEPNGQPILTDSRCESTLELLPTPGGFDLRVSVTNATDRPQERPAIVLTGFKLEPRLTYLDARRTGALRMWDATGSSSQWSPRLNYPDHLYSPVLALFDRRFAVGVSFIYDALEQRHGMSTLWGMEGARYQGTYRLTIEPFLRDVTGRAAEGNFVAPGATQTYRVAVRFAAPGDWLQTLEPYREHFRRTYGGVKYQADLTPVWGEPVAQAEFRWAHPRGYNPEWKVDEVGWGRFVDHVLRHVVPKGYRRVMIWAPSGLYSHNDGYPVEFMTEWSPAMSATVGQLERLRDAGVTVGMWWGQAGQVSGGFASRFLWVRDLSKQRDVAAGDNEARLAAARGVREIGLDAINAMPLWDRYAWVRRLQAMHPTLRFITETADCDIMHTIAPTFYNWRDHSTAPILTDWLNPGHETWVQLWYNESDKERFERIRAWGMVPVTMTTTVPHRPAATAGRRAQ